MTPNTRANSSTKPPPKRPAIKSGQPSAATATAAAMMNISPPMVGVPCLFLCQLGPTSRMVWPNFSLCRKGIIHFPKAAVMAKAITETNKYSMVLITSYPLSLCFLSFGRGDYPPAVAPVSALALSTKVKVITVPCCTCSPSATLWAEHWTLAESTSAPFACMFSPACCKTRMAVS